jgi:protein-tyrosine phosphatase
MAAWHSVSDGCKTSAMIDGSFNFRDIGGHQTDDGHIVRSSRVFRSGMMVHITEAGFAELADLDVRVICDLRTTLERNASPTQWQNMRVSDYWSRHYDDSAGDIGKLMQRPDFSAAESREAMFASYRVLALEQADSYRELFRRIAEGQLPLIFNCSAGKDRTGVATALLLTLLGVPRATILHEYAMTNEQLARDSRRLVERGVFMQWRDDEAFLPLVRAEPEYLSTMFAAIEKAFGSVDGYFTDELGLNRQSIEAIRREMREANR